MIHDIINEHGHLLDISAATLAFVAGAFTVAGISAVMSLVAATLSVVWLLIRIRDRMKYGPAR